MPVKGMLQVFRLMDPVLSQQRVGEWFRYMDFCHIPLQKQCFQHRLDSLLCSDVCKLFLRVATIFAGISWRLFDL